MENIATITAALKDLRDSIESDNHILINVWAKRVLNHVGSSAYPDGPPSMGETNLVEYATSVLNTVERHVLIHVGLKLKSVHAGLDTDQVTLSEAYNYINSLNIDDKYDNLVDLKKAAKRAFKHCSIPLMQVAIARAINLAEPRKKAVKNVDGYYMGSTKKGFKTEKGARSARTRYLKKYNIAVHHGEYEVVKVGDVYAIELPVDSKD